MKLEELLKEVEEAPVISQGDQVMTLEVCSEKVADVSRRLAELENRVEFCARTKENVKIEYELLGDICSSLGKTLKVLEDTVRASMVPPEFGKAGDEHPEEAPGPVRSILS